jgi:tetratricopeptide (TPR) repeat protein
VRFHLIGADGKPEDAKGEVEQLLTPFRVLADPDWAKRPELTYLDAARKARLIREVEEVLFLYASGLDPTDPRESRRGMDLCERALVFAGDPKPWKALRNWMGDAPGPSIAAEPQVEQSPKACYEWGLLLDKQGRKALSKAWLERAVTLEPNNSWYHYHLATLLVRSGEADRSLVHYQAALAVEPGNRRFWLDRAKAHRSIGEWAKAIEDEEQANRCASIKP